MFRRRFFLSVEWLCTQIGPGLDNSITSLFFIFSIIYFWHHQSNPISELLLQSPLLWSGSSPPTILIGFQTLLSQKSRAGYRNELSKIQEQERSQAFPVVQSFTIHSKNLINYNHHLQLVLIVLVQFNSSCSPSSLSTLYTVHILTTQTFGIYLIVKLQRDRELSGQNWQSARWKVILVVQTRFTMVQLRFRVSG